jgi:hypothetical protein
MDMAILGSDVLRPFINRVKCVTAMRKPVTLLHANLVY